MTLFYFSTSVLKQFYEFLSFSVKLSDAFECRELYYFNFVCPVLEPFVVDAVVYLTLTNPLRIQPWSQDRRNQTKSNREHGCKKQKQGKQTEEDGQEK